MKNGLTLLPGSTQEIKVALDNITTTVSSVITASGLMPKEEMHGHHFE